MNQWGPVSPEEQETQPKLNIAALIGRERLGFSALVSIVEFRFRIEEGICSSRSGQKGDAGEAG